MRHLGFLLRTVLFYDAYAEAPVLISVKLMMQNQCTPPASKPLVSACLFRASWPIFFSPGTLASFHKVKTDSDRYAGMTSSCPVTVYGSETHIKPH